MTLPRELRQGTRFEPSGLVWVPDMERYLLVSDDTGFKDQNDHAPWLFTMDVQGRVDVEPVVVRGIDEFNDLEAIATDVDGNLYVLSSQSHSKKGNRRRSRQVFARLTLEGGEYRVEQKVWLAEILDAAGARVLTGLGLGDTRELNIEGLTAARGGGLLLGLKAPLSAEGGAIIWRMRRPDRLLATGALDEAGLEAWAEVKLSVSAEGRVVPGGVSELLSLPGGALIIAATASGFRPARQDGALWHVVVPPGARRRKVLSEETGGTLTARRIHTFEGLKPEGLALSPGAGRMMVVFDADRSVPSWIELPLPGK